MAITKEHVTNHHLFELDSPALVKSLPTDLVEFLLAQVNPWNCLGKNLSQFLTGIINNILIQDRKKGKISPLAHLENSDMIFVAEGAVIEPFAYVEGPTWIGPGATIRHGAYVRGNVYVGAGAVVGHTTEAKGSVLLPLAKAAHFAYVGDSILGFDCNLGAGTKLANLRLDHGQIKIRAGNDKMETGLKKMGAVFGNRAQTGCNSVTNPGTILLPGAFLLPNSTGLGVVRAKG